MPTEPIDRRTPGERLYHEWCGSSTTDHARYFQSMNPAGKADWERLAATVGAPIHCSYCNALVGSDPTLCGTCGAEADSERDNATEAASDLVDALLDVLELVTAESFDHAPVGERVLAALDAERERTGVDEWDETDHRCALYNLAHAMSGRP